MPAKAPKKVVGMIVRSRKPILKDTVMTVSSFVYVIVPMNINSS